MATQTIEIDRFVPERVPVQATKALSTSAVDLGASGNITSESDTGWELWCASAWLVGDANGQVREVAAKEVFRVESNSLAGVYAKVASSTPTLVATGFRKVTP